MTNLTFMFKSVQIFLEPQQQRVVCLWSLLDTSSSLLDLHKPYQPNTITSSVVPVQNAFRLRVKSSKLTTLLININSPPELPFQLAPNHWMLIDV